MQKFIVSEKESRQTLEKYVRKVLKDAPLSFIYKLFRKKDIKVNGHWQKEKYVVSTSEEVSIYITDSQLEEFKKKVETKVVEDISNWIVYEDDNILVINKPRGVLVQGDNSGEVSLTEMVISYLINKKEYDPKLDLGYSPAPTHRLDRNTAGLVVFGKNLSAIREMVDILSNKEKVEKKYLTLVKGVTEISGEINAPLLKNSLNGRVSVSPSGKEAITQYHQVRVINNEYSLLEVKLLTGRTHQIRVHLASISHPVIGDQKYGDYSLNKEFENKYHFKNQFLVAYYLKFKSIDGKLAYLSNKSFKISLPIELDELLLKLEG